MSFTVDVPNTVWNNWKSRDDWYEDPIFEQYQNWLPLKYPEIKSATRRAFVYDRGTMFIDILKLEFESEAHYNWFLLKQ